MFLKSYLDVLIVKLEMTIRQLTNLTRLIEQTPIANLTENIRFDEIENLMKLLGLDNFINVTAAVEQVKVITKKFLLK